MRWRLGSCALAAAAVLAGPAPAYEAADGWGPFKLDMTLAQLRALPGFAWSLSNSFHPSPGHDWVTYRADKPVTVEGRRFELSVSFLDGGLREISLRRRLNLPEPACRAQYQALLARLEARYGPSEPAQAYSSRSHAVLDVPDGEDALVEPHEGLQSTSTLYRSYGVPTLLRTQFGPQGASLSEEMRLATVGGSLRCTDLRLVVR